MSSIRRWRVTAVAVPVMMTALALGPIAAAHAATAGATKPSAIPSEQVIVALRNSLSSTARASATVREAAAAVAQRPVIASLEAGGALHVKGLSLVNDVIATVSPAEEANLRADPDVAEVVPDELIRMASPSTVSLADVEKAGEGFSPAAGSCTSGKKAQLDPEAVEAIHAAEPNGTTKSAQGLGYTGAGVKVGFIADGIDTDNPDLIRADGKHVIVGYQDFSNSGTDSVTNGDEAFLDASSIAAQGREVYNLEDYGTGLDHRCDIRILGVAPGASLVDLDTFGDSDDNFTSALLEAIDYGVLHDHLNVINESFGDDPFPDVETLDLVERADSAAVARGTVVTASTGDAGPTNTIGSPATDPDVISAGATTTLRSYLQSGIGGAVGGPVKVTGWLDDNISALSSGGVSESGRTLDVVAPGDLNWALCSPYPAKYQACTNFQGKAADVELSGGTSEAGPLTAGTAALVIQAYREAHGGATPTPTVVKEIITSTAENVNAPADEQGAGMVDAYAAVLAARSYAGSKVATSGHAVLSAKSQYDAAGPAGTPETFHDSLTNDGSSPVTVHLASRTLGAYTGVATDTEQLTSANSYESVVKFTVPAGRARLDARIAYTSRSDLSTAGAAVAITLYSPKHQLAAYSLPQGDGDYGDVGVADPAAGTWTALIAGTAPSTVHFGAQVAHWTSFGTVSPTSMTLAAGASASVALDVKTPASAGDVAGSITITSESAAAPSFTRHTSVPVVLRSYVATPSPTTTFDGTLTGGNGRSTDTGVSAHYDVDIAAGSRALNASITVPSKADTFTAELVSPAGIAMSTSSNTLLENTTSGAALQEEPGTQLHVVDPTAGVWTLAINFYNEVSGTALDQTYGVSMSTSPSEVSASGLPDSSSTELAKGTPTAVGVTVTNTGATPEAYFLDARLATTSTTKLAPLTTSAVQLPDLGTTTATYLVPAATTSVSASVSSPKPAVFDFAYLFGDPDLIAGATTRTDHPSRTFSESAGVPAGVWAVVPYLDGPDGAKGSKATVQTAMTATTATFDSAVTSPTGDLWEEAVDASAGVTPYVVEPGQSVTIPVTITPTAVTGSTVAGTLYLDDDSGLAEDSANTLATAGGILPGGSELAALPYRYTVGS